MSSDNVYDAITEANDARWAFGTGFTDPLAGVGSSVPDGVDGADLAAYCLMLGDDALVMSHRLQQWCSNGPELEDEVALANIALDLLGQARLLLARAGAVDGSGRGEDAYAFSRAEHEFRNVRLAELECGDFGELTARLPAGGLFELHPDYGSPRYRFGREPDGRPALAWSWTLPATGCL